MCIGSLVIFDCFRVTKKCVYLNHWLNLQMIISFYDSKLTLSEVQSILKEINFEYSLEWFLLKLKIQYYSHLMRTDLLEPPWLWETLKAKAVGRLGVGRRCMYVCMCISSVQFSSVAQSCSNLCDPMIGVHHQASLSITNSQSLHKFMFIKSVMPSSYLILCHLLLLLPPIPPSIRVFSNESTLHMRWLKYWSLSFSISRSNEHPGLISFRMDWLDLLVVQGTLKSLLQHHSSKASILRHLDFFTVHTWPPEKP